ncbi:MAG: DNA modification methylase [Planctomycetota bacterium]
MIITRVPLDSVHPDPANVRLHNERNLDAVKGSLARFGQQKPIVVDRKGTIRAGNGTYAAAKALGWTEIDVVATDLEGVEAVAYAIADNRTSDLSSFDDEALAKLLIELREEEELAGTGFDDADLDKLLMELGKDLDGIQQDEAPLAPLNPVTERGDLWVLGRHRLLCGDSSSAEDVDRLLAGAPIHLVNTDPPYNVKVEPRSNNAIAAGLSSFTATHHQGLDLARHPEKAKPTHERMRAKDRPLANDFLPEEEFDRLLRAWFGNIARVLLPGRGFYIWGGYANLANYPSALRENELYFSQAIVWDKQHPVLTRKDFMGAFELAFYGWKEGAAHEFFGPANITDLWAVKKVNPQSMVHLTEKPVELAVRAIEYSSKRGEHVLDLFGGSGSTLIACEQVERSAYLVELDEAYCDVIVERWQKLAGKDAVLEANGETFAATKEKRQ